ncbi:hypothetical protein [Spirosoma agri]|uniref:Uncharacterized protein n=1 Tax=Spirosoma agri TaxID=1987381 RepID=A0A6M0IDS5_9BACT|nr:hypothetical protein [Spirosoma agri]NEU65862.1 hypothetical protein [Spirosoma agri]
MFSGQERKINRSPALSLQGFSKYAYRLIYLVLLRQRLSLGFLNETLSVNEFPIGKFATQKNLRVDGKKM